jgi:hypothetical protein
VIGWRCIVTLAWIAACSHAGADESASARSSDQPIEVTAIEETPIDAFDRDHWAYREIDDPAIPTVQRSDWPRTAIDRFILNRIEAESLVPASEADRETLIRRLSFDLTGLPPTPRQLDDYLRDTRPDAYARLVDSFLASPEFGRRWAQYWLDLARFAETDGYEHDKVRPGAWQYRDWVIDAITQDTPYDQFVRWQIAGDVLAPEEYRRQGEIATAFCLSGPDMPDINSQQERKHVLMNEITSTVGAVFFSLQIGCAQCHDHKYDAISQADFYRLRAFFEPAVRLEKNKSVTTLAAAADTSATSHLMIRGDWRRTGPALEAAFPRIADRDELAVTDVNPGRARAQLARWLTTPDHPLVSRTIVNRVWQHHFGRGLSTTPSDFGVMGDEPSHPELLDFLARRLTDHDWSLKDLHREIVLSSVYRIRSGRPDASLESEREDWGAWQASIEKDPGNRLLSRFPRRRLDAESLRDAMLAVSETLNHEGGGPGVQPPLPPEIVNTLKSGQWTASERVADHFRRSIYIFARRNLRYPFFATFDRPPANTSCAARQPSTTAVQSLLLFNSNATIDAARRLADAVARREPADESKRCQEVYRRLFSRSPSSDELAECITFLQQQSALLRSEGRDQTDREAWADLCRALLNTNAFLYVD